MHLRIRGGFRTTPALLVFVSLCACPRDVTYRDVDPPVDYGDLSLTDPTGTPTLDVGLYREQLYSPLNDGDACPVVAGPQGGTWLMPAVRMRGVAARADVRCVLSTLTGEQLGTSAENVRFALAPDGWLETQSFAVPVNHAPPREAEPITDLYGKDATLDCQVTDTGARTATRTVRVRLVEGT